MAMMMLLSRIPLTSPSLTTSSPSPIASLPRYYCNQRQEKFCYSYFAKGRLTSKLNVHNQILGFQKARVVASDAATTTQSGADEAVEYEEAEALTMHIKMEGTMADTNGSRMTKTLEVIEGVGNVKVSVEEGMTTIELTKKTNIQATGVASELVDAAQKAGFKMQSLCLGFDDEEINEDDALYFGSSSTIDAEEIAAI